MKALASLILFWATSSLAYLLHGVWFGEGASVGEGMLFGLFAISVYAGIVILLLGFVSVVAFILSGGKVKLQQDDGKVTGKVGA